MKRIQHIFMTLGVVLGMGVVVAGPVGAINVFDQACKGNNKTAVCSAKDDDNANDLVQTVVAILLWAVGVISVIMVIVGSIRYVISGGDASQIKAARETIIYALAGLVVAMVSFALVKFIVGWF